MRCALLLLPLALAGCTRDQNRWTPGTTGQGLTVVVAPVAAPALVGDWPAAPTELAYTAAGRIDLFGKGLDGLVGETLPPADAPAWATPVADAAAATVIVLVTLEAPTRTLLGSTPQVRVNGTVRVIDPQGHEEFRRPISGTADDIFQAKLIGPAHLPLSQACTAAAADAAGQAVDYLKARGTGPALPPQVTLTLASTPANADVLVDGQLKGTTPCTVQVPTGKAVVLRLERQGHRPWERTLTPKEPLSLSPALEPAP